MISNFKTYILILVLISFYFSTLEGSPFPTKSQKKELSEADKIKFEILESTACQLQQKYDLAPFGYGVSGLKQIESLDLSFEVFRPLSKRQARAIIFEASEILLQNINNSKEIKKYLKDGYFDINNVGISLYIKNQKGEQLYHPEICIASTEEDGARYYSKDPENKIRFKKRSFETREQALSKLAQSKNLTPAEEKKPSPK